MADEVASLVLRVDSTQAKGASSDLDKLATSGAKAEQAALDVGTAGKAAAAGLGAMGQAAKTTQAQAAAAAMSAGELRMAMRSLPMQMTDIAVGLSTGQSPFYVLMQQGGQLKDLFGGIGPAIKAVAGYVAGLVTPFTAAAAGAVALAVAYQQGAEEGRRFNAAITMTGNAAGVTDSQLAAMAKRIGDVQGTTGNAAAALTKLVDTGKIAGDAIEGLGRAAVLSEAAAGRSVEDMIKDYERIADAPAEALTKLNERYHFLSLAVYERVRSLEDEGRQQDAARLALNTYAQAMEERSNQVVRNAGYMERAWNAVKGAAKGAWDAIADVGRPDSSMAVLNGLEREARQRRENIALAEQSGASVSKAERASLAAAEARVALAREQMQTQSAIAKAQALDAERSTVGIAARQELNKLIEQGASNEEKRTKALEENEERIRRIRAAGGTVTDKEEAASIEAINKQYEKRSAAAAGTVAAGVRELEQARQQEAALRAQLESAVKITTARQELVKFEQRIADLKAKDQLTADEKSVLANETAIRQQLELNSGLADQITLQKEVVQQKVLERSAQETLIADQQRYNDLLSGYTASPRVREQLLAQQQIYRDFQRQVQRAAEQQAAGELSPQGYAVRVSVLKQSLDDRLALQADYYSQLSAMEADWRNGAIGGLNDYAETAANVASAARSAFSDAFRGMEDALTEFVTTGKLSFSDMVRSILADIARIAIRQGITGPLASVLGASLGGGFGGAFSGIGGLGSATAANVASAGGGLMFFDSGGYTGPGAKDTPRGIVHAGEIVWSQDDIARSGGVAVVEAMRLSAGQRAYTQPLMAAAAPSAPKITVQNYGTPQDYEVGLTRDEVILISRDQIYREGPRMVSGELSKSNSRSSRAMQSSFNVERKR